MNTEIPRANTAEAGADRFVVGNPWLLPLGFVAVIFLLILVTAIGLIRITDINRKMQVIVEQHNRKTDLLMTMYTAARERSVVLLSMAALEDPFERDEKFMQYNALATTFAVARIALSNMPLSDTERADFEEQGRITGEVIPQQEQVVNLLTTDDNREAAIELLLKRAVPDQDKILQNIRNMLDYQRAEARAAFETARAFGESSRTLMSALAALTVLLSLAIATFVTRKARRDDSALRAARDTLEQRVDERTRELSIAYDELKAHEREIVVKNRTLETLSSQLAKYLSPQVYASIFSGRQEVRLTSQRKKLTILFSDIVGFTELTDKMESEDLTQLLNRYLTEMSAVALEHGATIDKFIGDAIMLFFGDPESQGVKEDALACVKMAVAMQQRIDELAAEWRDSGIAAPLSCRIGIHTGFCTVGNFGSEDRMDYTVVGGAVNLAARLEAAGERGSILISYDTYAHVKDAVVCEPLGPTSIRGQAYPVETYRVLGLRTAEDAQSGTFEAQLPHMRLELHVDDMTDKEREAAARQLTDALKHLR